MFSKDLLNFFICAKMTPDDVLVLGEDSETLALHIKTFVGDHNVRALPSISEKSAHPGAPANLGTSIDIVQDQPTTVGKFRCIVCWGPSTMLDASGLPSLLRLWRTYLKSDGRIVLRMYPIEGEEKGDWRAMESRYRDAADRSRGIISWGGMGLEEINGLYSDTDLQADRSNVRQLVRLIEGIASRVQEVNPGRGDQQALWLRRRAEKIGDWKGFRDLTETERDRLVRVNSGNEAFYATFRPE